MSHFSLTSLLLAAPVLEHTPPHRTPPPARSHSPTLPRFRAATTAATAATMSARARLGQLIEEAGASPGAAAALDGIRAILLIVKLVVVCDLLAELDALF